MLTPASSATSASRASARPCRQITATVASRIWSRRPSMLTVQQYRIIGTCEGDRAALGRRAHCRALRLDADDLGLRRARVARVPLHGLRGYYDGLDAMISFHPFWMLPLCNTVRWDTHCAAFHSRIYSFVCDRPETWNTSGPSTAIAAPHAAARAPGANAALFAMYSSVK